MKINIQKNLSMQHVGIGVLLAGGLLMQLTAQADIKHTKEVRMGDDPKAAPMQVITTAIRKNARREETRVAYGPVQMNSVTLTLCEKKQSIRLDPKLKIYTVAALDDNGQPVQPPAPGAARDSGGNNGPAGTGKIIMTTNVKDFGEEMVAEQKTRHYMITNRMQSSGCAGDADTTMKMEIWVADIREPLACEVGGEGDPARAYAGGKPNCKITFEQKGDKDAYTKAYNGMILRMKMYNGDKVTMVQDTTMLSQAKIEDDSLFSVPADYKQVSAQEFQQAQSKAMMDAMMSGAARGNMGGNNANDNGDDNEGKADNGKADNGDDKDGNDQEDKPKEQPKEEKKKDKKKFRLPGGFGF